MRTLEEEDLRVRRLESHRRYDAKPETKRAKQVARREREHHLSEERFNDLYSQQLGRCAICLSPFESRIQIDHDHKCCPGARSCGECIRGLLCGPCNRGIGLLTDDPVVLRRAANYLEGMI